MSENAELNEWCKKMYESHMELIKKINHQDNASKIGLTQDQVKSLSEYVVEAINTEGESCGSYRSLIYGVLESVGYCDGMDMGLLDLNNALIRTPSRARMIDALKEALAMLEIYYVKNTDGTSPTIIKIKEVIKDAESS